MIRSESRYAVKIPAGIDDGGTIRISGKGESPGLGGTPGDLYVVVHVQPDSRFERRGDDIFPDIHVSYSRVALGSTVDVDTVDGKKKLVIPAGTQPHQQIRLRGLGMPQVGRSGRGDHYVRVIVDVPKKVGRKAKKLLEELAGEIE